MLLEYKAQMVGEYEAVEFFHRECGFTWKYFSKCRQGEIGLYFRYCPYCGKMVQRGSSDSEYDDSKRGMTHAQREERRNAIRQEYRERVQAGEKKSAIVNDFVDRFDIAFSYVYRILKEK
jgi:hypothetical protein